MFCPLDVFPDLLNLFTEFLHTLHINLFVIPLRFLSGKFLPELRKLLLQVLQAFSAQPVVLFLKRRLLNLHLHDLPLQLVKLCRHRIKLCLNEGARLVHKVYGLVRQKPVGNVAVRENRRRHKRAVRYLHPVEHLVPLLKAPQYRYGILHRRLVNQHRLEPPLKSRVFLNILPVFIERRSTDAVQLASCQHRFQHIARIHGSVRLACSHDGMQLVDKQDDPPVAFLHFLQDCLQPFLELSPVLRTRHQRPHIQGKYRLLF